MDSDLEEQLVAIETAGTPTLRAQWLELYGREAPKRASKMRLRLGLAWALQTREQGGLKPQLQRKLERLGAALDRGEAPPSITRPRIRPGTTLIREWGGERHTVVAMPDGYLYREASYKSLSHIAREITGTRWNGPAFFGLRKNRKEEVHAG